LPTKKYQKKKTTRGKGRGGGSPVPEGDRPPKNVLGRLRKSNQKKQMGFRRRNNPCTNFDNNGKRRELKMEKNKGGLTTLQVQMSTKKTSWRMEAGTKRGLRLGGPNWKNTNKNSSPQILDEEEGKRLRAKPSHR